MNPTRTLLVAALALAAAAPAHAEFFSGRKLLDRLEAGDRYDRNVGRQGDSFDGALGMGFVIGVYDVYVQDSFCSRQGVTVGQAVSITLTYLRAIPHRHHEAAYVLVKEALDRAFPCEGRRQQQSGRGV